MALLLHRALAIFAFASLLGMGFLFSSVQPSAADEEELRRLMERVGAGETLSDAELDRLLKAMPPEEVSVNLVIVPVLVVDKKGRTISGLQASDFTILEQGQPREIVSFSSEGDWPVRMALLLDVSGSMDHAFRTGWVRRAVLPSLRQIRTDRDHVKLLSFASGRVEQQTPWNQRPLLMLGRALTLPRDGETALTDALLRTARLMPKTTSERQAIVLVSDGLDNASEATANQVIKAAQYAEVPVYVIAIGGASRAAQDAHDAARSPYAPLREVASESGGRFFLVPGRQDAEAVASTLIGDLRSQYLLAFRPLSEPDGAFRQIEVQVDRRGAQVLSRAGYR